MKQIEENFVLFDSTRDPRRFEDYGQVVQFLNRAIEKGGEIIIVSQPELSDDVIVDVNNV